MQNGYVDSFNGRTRDELLDETLFLSLDHARLVIAASAEEYNQEAHGLGLEVKTLAAFAAEPTARRSAHSVCLPGAVEDLRR